MNLHDILKEAVDKKASDIFFIVGQPITYKIAGELRRCDMQNLMPNDTSELIEQMYQNANRPSNLSGGEVDDDFAISMPGIGRFRTNIFQQRGTLSAIMRVVSFELPSFHEMGIPENVLEYANKKKGLILVTGTAGSGKSTTLSYIIDQINRSRNCHI